jgi:hypothetical protein
MADEQGTQGQGQGSVDSGTGQGTQGQGQQQGQQQQQQGTQGQQQSSQQSGQSGTGQQTGSQFTYTEDRSKWIPPHRLNEVSGKSRELEARLAERDRQIAALTGTKGPETEDDSKAARTREAFYKMFPFMKQFEGMSEEEIQAIREVPKQVNSTKDAESRQWRRHSDQQVSLASELIADAMGSETLDDEQTEDVRTTFSAWLKKKVNAELQVSDGEKSDTLDRYEAADKKLVEEFSNSYTKRWVDPARRKAAASNVNRTKPVPNSGGRNAQTSTATRPDKFKNIDERLDFAVKLGKERGVLNFDK